MYISECQLWLLWAGILCIYFLTGAFLYWQHYWQWTCIVFAIKEKRVKCAWFQWHRKKRPSSDKRSTATHCFPQSRFLSRSLETIMENAGCVKSGVAPVSSEQGAQEGLSLTSWAGSPPELATCAGFFSPSGHLREIFPPTEMSFCECGIQNTKFATYHLSSIKNI